MGFMNKINVEKIKDTVAKNSDKAEKAIDKAASVAGTRAGSKQRGKIDSAALKAKDYVRKLDQEKRGGTARPVDRIDPIDPIDPPGPSRPGTPF
ncbi:MAG TPA: antitoxin [Aquihabitans sp.]|jgi:hypothetical protein|nr:antitoxin [Aquihabitans sp.]